MALKLIFILLMVFLSHFVYAVPCPIPYVHMKFNYFTLSSHKATTTLKDSQNGFIWSVVILTDKLIIDQNVVDSFLRANKVQQNATTGPGGLGMSKYACYYLNPFPYSATFRAYSDGN